MSPLLDALRSLGEATVLSLWVPMGAWSLFALAVWGVLLLWRRLDVLPQYAIRAALLCSLPVSLAFAWLTEFSPLVRWTPAVAGTPFLPPVDAPAAVGVTVHAPVMAWSVYHSLGLLTLLAAGIALFKLGRLAYHSALLLRSSRRIGTMPARAPGALLESSRREVGLHRPVRLAVTSLPVPPMTYGIVRPLVVVPEALLEDPDALRLTLLHELIHVRRHDVLVQWIERAIGSLFAVNPVVIFLRRSVAYYREAAVDAEVLRQPAVSGKRYATLLLLYSTPATPAPALALPMTASPHTLKKRIVAMTARSTSRFLTPQWIVVCVALVVGAASLFVACTDNLNVEVNIGDAATDRADATEARATYTEEAADATEETFVVVEQMPELIGGLASIQEKLRYPEIARRAGIEGRVIVQFVVDRKGRVEHPQVIRGVGSGLDEEALRALEEARFRPGRQRGQTVRVKMTLPITFRLNPETASNAPAGILRPASPTRRMRLVELTRSEDGVRGRVIAEGTGLGIPGATIVAPGTQLGAATDADGTFYFRVALDVQAFEITHTGYNPLTLHVGPSVIK